MPDALRLYSSLLLFLFKYGFVHAAPRKSFVCCSVCYLINRTGVKQGGVMQVYFQDNNGRRRLFLYVWRKWLPSCHLKKKRLQIKRSSTCIQLQTMVLLLKGLVFHFYNKCFFGRRQWFYILDGGSRQLLST